ncbi:hypothetical protein M2139_001636 [Enterococcus sp. PF1-24]|uniref:hypothetical protein n=1 Tax=unclassified Enterococcus TaxID=2608891 RepID=UPI002476AECF|nr:MULTISPECIES: hypothetical protein [unclassified Enterococcus]MDH6364649.1 hypothetical protein [Enterococcus sp. PFB1-1]MDH6401750.1 hypothetical protein [Enterococcus sp. PF1-24]
MAYKVAKILGMSPEIILDNWSVPLLIVTFGNYINDETLKEYHTWKNMDATTRSKTPRPEKYGVRFLDDSHLEGVEINGE